MNTTITRKLLITLWAAIIGCFAVACAETANGQTNAPPPSWISMMPAASVTNIATTVYGSHFDANNKYGGGALLTYNLNSYAGTSIAMDWAGSWKLFGGGLKLQYPFTWGQFTVTPMALMFIQTPLSGAGAQNGALATAEGGGFGVNVWKKLDVSFGWVNRTSCGDFSGGSEFLSFTWRF
jgi:hypothetical protein